MKAPSERPISALHSVILGLLREKIAAGSINHTDKLKLTDNEFVRLLFSNVRGKQGLRLSRTGLTIMRRYFKPCVVEMPPGGFLTSRHLLFLDSHSTMPYYCSQTGYVLFDLILGVKLKLADGDFNLLIEIEGGTT